MRFLGAGQVVEEHYEFCLYKNEYINFQKMVYAANSSALTKSDDEPNADEGV